MRLDLIFSRQAERQYKSLFHYLKKKAGLAVAKNYTNDIYTQCDNLRAFPFKGSLREELGQGYRSFGYKKRVTIVFKSTSTQVIIVGIFYGGQDLHKALAP